MASNSPLLIDTHAHLDSGQFDADREAVIARARENGISHILTVGTDLPSSRLNVKIARRHADIYAAAGIHPHDALTATDEAITELQALIAGEPKIVAVGEIGLDFYRDRAPRDAQRDAFRRQIRLAREVGLPLIVHDRDAHDEVLAILREERAEEVGGVLHCFSGDLAMARACIELGFYISFPGTITYPEKRGGTGGGARRADRAYTGRNRLPVPGAAAVSGRRNEPAYVRYTAEEVAAIKGLSIADVARITTLNAWRLFGIGKAEQSARASPMRSATPSISTSPTAAPTAVPSAPSSTISPSRGTHCASPPNRPPPRSGGRSAIRRNDRRWFSAATANRCCVSIWSRRLPAG